MHRAHPPLTLNEPGVRRSRGRLQLGSILASKICLSHPTLLESLVPICPYPPARVLQLKHVKNVPVNYAIRSSGPMTSSPSARTNDWCIDRVSYAEDPARFQQDIGSGSRRTRTQKLDGAFGPELVD